MIEHPLLGIKTRAMAFTLAELLIALAILGVIATFTIPKILSSGSSAEWNTKALEASGMASEALLLLKREGLLSDSTRFRDLTPYMNYVRYDSTTLIDNTYEKTTFSCSTANNHCLVLHNGAILRYQNAYFADTSASTSAIVFYIDPDGKVTSTGAIGAEGKSVALWIYANGRIRDRGNLEPNTMMSTNSYIASPATVPPWFNWGN